MISKKRYVTIWMVSLMIFTAIMVLVGGITRLTGSGLSMVDWQPVTGVLPPLNADEWQATFDAYKQSPEYIHKNSGMSLEGFKRIFFWEYLHRILGRITGLVALIPWFGFLCFSSVPIWKRLSFVRFPLLVAGQGIMGWLMVASGLVDNPFVSHYRLAAHLLLAFFIFGCCVYVLAREKTKSTDLVHSKNYKIGWMLFGLLNVQILYGAFTAGLKGGHGFNTFPLMDGALIPTFLFKTTTFLDAIFNHPFCVQFIHRWLGIGVGCLGIYWAVSVYKSKVPTKVFRKVVGMVIGLWVQILLGIVTLLTYVSLHPAVTHQMMALLLVGGFLHLLVKKRPV